MLLALLPLHKKQWSGGGMLTSINWRPWVASSIYLCCRLLDVVEERSPGKVK